MIPASGWRTLCCVLTSASTPDQVHARQMMTEVATVSIVAKNKYSGKAGGLPHPARGGTKVGKPFTWGFSANKEAGHLDSKHIPTVKAHIGK